MDLKVHAQKTLEEVEPGGKKLAGRGGATFRNGMVEP